NELENLSNVNFIKLINSMIKELEYTIKQKDIDITFLYEENYKTIKGEEFMFSLLLRNLLDNAIRYNKKGTFIQINLKKNSLTIEDNGKGLSPQVLENIGERFIRPAGQKQTGSGLGFSIVQQIAQLHNLDIHFQNITPNGFRVTLVW
ncbi:MAG: ATP-binding protein, partial [Arcobacteraceae bacterium]